MADTHEARVVLRDGMHFEGFAGEPEEDSFAIQLDAAEPAGGQGKGAPPARLLLVSLAGCMGMDVLSILRKKRQEVSGFEVHAHAARAEEHPMVYTHIQVTFQIMGEQIDPVAVERAIELSVTRYCPIANLLKPVVPIETDYQIITDGRTK
jgi:putative redox protein